MVVKVPVDGEPVSPDPLGLPGGAGPGPPLDHTGCVALGPHQLWDLIVLLQGLCGEERMRKLVPGGAKVPETCCAAVHGPGVLGLCGGTTLQPTVMLLLL